jgi:hypothetical protein
MQRILNKKTTTTRKIEINNKKLKSVVEIENKKGSSTLNCFRQVDDENQCPPLLKH